MAKVTYINSILSGKLGGLVYSFNKAGNYVRTFRTPTNPNTGAQINNRAHFANSVSAWHALGDINKGSWNTFAITVFKPKFGTPGVRYSGFNAFTSLRNVALNMQAKATTSTITLPAATTNTFGVFSPSNNAPTLGLSSNIKNPVGLPIPITLLSVEYSIATEIFTTTLGFPGPLSPGISGAGPNFEDAISGKQVGIALVGSLPISQENQFVENPEINLLAVINPPGQIDDWTLSPSITFATPQVPEFNTRKIGYTLGDIIQVKAYLISSDGMTQPLNAVTATIDA